MQDYQTNLPSANVNLAIKTASQEVAKLIEGALAFDAQRKLGREIFNEGLDPRKSKEYMALDKEVYVSGHQLDMFLKMNYTFNTHRY